MQGGPEQRTWLKRLDFEQENFFAAHAWCGHAEGAAALGLRLVYAIRNCWVHRGLDELGYQMTVEALARAAAQEPSPARCGALNTAAVFAFGMGRYAEAQEHLEESLSIARALGGEERLATTLRLLGMVFQVQGKRPEARRHLEEALDLARRLGQKIMLSAALSEVAELKRFDGELDSVEPLYEEALTLARASGALLLSAGCLLNLSAVSIARRSGNRTRKLLLEALAIVEETDSKPTGIDAIEKTAGLAALFGEWRRAAQLFGAAEAQCKQMGLHREPVDEAFLEPLIAQTREALGEAAFAAAEASGRTLSYESALAEARAWLQEGEVTRKIDRQVDSRSEK